MMIGEAHANATIPPTSARSGETCRPSSRRTPNAYSGHRQSRSNDDEQDCPGGHPSLINLVRRPACPHGARYALRNGA
jgi:hypothetical protein